MTLRQLLVDEIDDVGPISFSRFMELTLYHPELGFYASGGAGRRRDFITSPEVGPLFGAVVARAIDSWWDELGRPDEFVFIDAGAGPGTLARSILRSELACAEALHYVAVETSELQRSRHPAGVTSVEVAPDNVPAGAVLANELLDNLPFDLLHGTPGLGWQEVRVGHQAGLFMEVLVAPSDDRPLPPVPAVDVRIPVQRAAQAWLERSLASLARGPVVVIDYAVDGYPVEPGREWLRTYSDQGRAGSPLDDPGAKDITADVDLAALAAIAAPSFVRHQRAWLTDHGIEELVAEGKAHWRASAARPDLRALEMRSRVGEAEALLDPAGLGRFAVVRWDAGVSLRNSTDR